MFLLLSVLYLVMWWPGAVAYSVLVVQFQIVQILGASGHTVPLFLNIQYWVFCLLFSGDLVSFLYVRSTQYPCACGFGMDMRPNSESDLWRQRGVSRVARGCRTRLRGDSTGWPGQVALASCMHWPSAVYGVCVRRFPIVDCRFEFRASKLINSKSNSIFEPRN